MPSLGYGRELGCETTSLSDYCPGVRLEHPSIVAELETTLTRTLRDRFRCPDEFLEYRLTGELSRDPGYFEFGADTVFYGRFVNGVSKTRSASDINGAGANPQACGGQPVLSFDVDEVIDNLRLERYPGCQLNEFEKALKRTYYWLRPLTSRRLRSYIKTLRAGKWKKRSFPQWPVDTTVDDIADVFLMRSLQAKGIERIPFIWFWPDGARGCVSITHDVETASGKDLCPDLMDLDDSFGIKSSFQIIPEDRYTVSQSFLNQFSERGFELCVQDLNHDGRLFDDKGDFCRRAALINRFGKTYGAKGFRSAALYRNPEWFGSLDFSFDMSVPNVAHLDPQRGGCCTVMPYFIGRLVELPLTTIQDYMLFHILNERSVDLWRLQLEMILAKNGLATFLIHPDYIIDPRNRAVYNDLLVMLNDIRKREPLWFALPGEIDSWWRERSRMSIVADRGSWRITGKGAERAKLAFAKVADGQLIYELADANHGWLSSTGTTSSEAIGTSI
jgi:hypothetical protein